MSPKNVLILHTKKYLWKCRIDKQVPSFIGLKWSLKDFLGHLKVSYSFMKKSDLFDLDWGNLYNKLHFELVKDAETTANQT